MNSLSLSSLNKKITSCKKCKRLVFFREKIAKEKRKQFINLNKKIIACKKCKRLKNFREKIAKEKRKQYINEKYWGKPITGFGDLNGKIALIGLAPAAHGGNRTGRVFTGDRSADFLYKCLHKAKMSNQPTSENNNDGLKLYNTYVTTACLLYTSPSPRDRG